VAAVKVAYRFALDPTAAQAPERGAQTETTAVAAVAQRPVRPSWSIGCGTRHLAAALAPGGGIDAA
jgi:hypothetical protein